jgi:hypothetical protein
MIIIIIYFVWNSRHQFCSQECVCMYTAKSTNHWSHWTLFERNMFAFPKSVKEIYSTLFLLWSRRKGQNDKQWFTKTWHRETKDRATRTPLNTGVKTDQNSEIHHILMQYFCKMMTFKSYWWTTKCLLFYFE